MKALLPLALALVLAGCNAPSPEPAAEPVPADTAPAPDNTAPTPPTAEVPPPVDDDDDRNGDGGTASIPERYRGEWNSDSAACGSASESRLVVGEDTIRFYESSGPVQSARMDGNELVVVPRLTGEGETRDATYRFRLSADGNTLTDAGSGLARQRCG